MTTMTSGQRKTRIDLERGFSPKMVHAIEAEARPHPSGPSQYVPGGFRVWAIEYCCGRRYGTTIWIRVTDDRDPAKLAARLCPEGCHPSGVTDISQSVSCTDLDFAVDDLRWSAAPYIRWHRRWRNKPLAEITAGDRVIGPSGMGGIFTLIATRVDNGKVYGRIDGSGTDFSGKPWAFTENQLLEWRAMVR